MKKESADIVFLDPPFNLGKDYGDEGKKGDQLDEHFYEAYLRSVITTSISILKPGGALYLYHIPQWAIRFSRYLEPLLEFRHWISVSMKNGLPHPNALYPAHYALLYYTKGKATHFSRPKIPPQRCRHCNQYVRDYGGYLKYVKDGINLSDVWDDVSPVRHGKYKHRMCNELPPLILERIIDISGCHGGVLVDPFVGSGTSAAVAVSKGMRFRACDKNPKFCELTIDRVKSALSKESQQRKVTRHDK